MSINKKRTFLGPFETEIEAAKAYDAKVRELNLSLHLLNFPPGMHVDSQQSLLF